MFHLALFQWRMLRAEGDDNALRAEGSAFFTHPVSALGAWARLAVGVQPAATGQRLQPDEADVLASLAANADSKEFIAPFALAQRLAATGDGGVGIRRGRACPCPILGGHKARPYVGQQYVHRLDRRRGYGLDGEWTGNARSFLVHEGLVVERFLIGVPGDGRVNLRARHAFPDV